MYGTIEEHIQMLQSRPANECVFIGTIVTEEDVLKALNYQDWLFNNHQLFMRTHDFPRPLLTMILRKISTDGSLNEFEFKDVIKDAFLETQEIYSHPLPLEQLCQLSTSDYFERMICDLGIYPTLPIQSANELNVDDVAKVCKELTDQFFIMAASLSGVVDNPSITADRFRKEVIDAYYRLD